MIEEVKKIIEKRRKELSLTKKDLYEGLGMSSVGFNQMLDRGTITVKNLVSLADILKVEPSYLLNQGEGQTYSEREEELRDQIAQLRQDKAFLQSTLSRVLEMKGEGE